MDKIEVNVNDVIAHISDIHVRYGSRHEEYRVVFQRTINDIKTQNPRRIVLTGDLFHIKITLSPNAMVLAGWFMKELSKIAPVDVLLGNHDLNLQSLAQGNALDPIIEFLDNGYYVTKESPTLTEHTGEGNGIYFFKESGFYDVDEDIVYGIYSCLDNEMLNLTDKKAGKKYIALYHGPVYGCRGDNGHELRGDDLINLSVFKNFDMVMLGDIHEQQAFTANKDSNIETIAYAGSLIQQGYGESLNKGYLTWNLDENTFKRKFIPNDCGYSSLHISRGELVEERIEDLQLSNDPKRTKVNIVWEAYQEEYSVEKEKQIERAVKTKYGCDSVSVECKFVKKEGELDVEIDENTDYTNSEDFEELLKEFVDNSEYENEDEVIELSRDIDKMLNYSIAKGSKWHLDKMEVWNLYGFSEKEVSFDFNQLKGIIGIFGKNYSGKSNVIRALVWILYQKMLGGGDSDKLVNMYTESNEAGGRVYITIDSQKYFIERKVKVTIKKDGNPKVEYGIKYNKLTLQEDGTHKWKKVDSDKAATEKKERSNIIVESIGTFDDFTKVVLQGNFLAMKQQPKNDLINKYLGLEIFRDRYDYGKKKFNDIKAKQKILGDPKQYRDKIEEEEKSKLDNENIVKKFTKENVDTNIEIDSYDKKMLELTKTLIKVEETKYSTVELANKAIKTLEVSNGNYSSEIKILEEWLGKNFKKELPEDSLLEPKEIEKQLTEKRSSFDSDKKDYTLVDNWIKANKKNKETDLEPINKEISTIDSAISKLKDKLEVSKGKKCPTCNNVEKAPDPTSEKKCKEDIARGEEALTKKKKELTEAKESQAHNLLYDKKEVQLGSLKNSLQTKKIDIDKLKKDLETSKGLSDIKAHNKLVSDNSASLNSKKELLLKGESEIEKINGEIKTIDRNKSLVEKNAKINKEISENDFAKKTCKLRIVQLNEKISEAKSAISVSKINVENYKKSLEDIVDAEKSYGKYAIYLQAVHRDGIPAKIIRQKLPIINHRINSILRNLVEFKIELLIKTNGDIKEAFYFNTMESDSLPMSMSSGAQTFVGGLAIRDALHFVSSLTKPSLCIIDEGFGSLDDELTTSMQSVFDYLRTKYKNTWVITHKNVVKDYVDSIIMVTKTQKGLTSDQIEKFPNAKVSSFDINY